MDLAARLMRKGTASKRLRAGKRRGPKRPTRTAGAKNAGGVSGKPAPVEAEPPAPAPFTGGKMVFYPDRVELCGVTILGDTGSGQCRAVLDVLKRRKPDGRYVRVGGEKLAAELGAEGGRRRGPVARRCGRPWRAGRRSA
ncbi:MAG: hypothetical protein AMK72_12850 [Planctomycetes bacterium SM23_25]|nr:MAG: hypothetical protein AMK72_12850 [Planctomycetes bacterium SM23_25]